MFNRGREADNHFLRVSRGRENQQLRVFVRVCVFVWLHSGPSFIFTLPHSPLGFHRLRLSDGEKQAKLGSVDTDEPPVVMMGAV